MIVINSAAYVVPEFRNELGAIPPCFLPLGNQKLLQHQVRTLRQFEGERIVVSLPSSYELTLDERGLLKALQVEVVAIPDGFTLAEAVTYVLNVAADGVHELRLLHGDTLILDLPETMDTVAVGRPWGEYDWETEFAGEGQMEDALVWAGFFAFSSQREFLRTLALSRGNFVHAVRSYGQIRSLTAEPCAAWFDLGHVNTYFYSRSKITTQRSFNALQTSEGIVYKTGVPPEKIEAEERWFKSVPLAVKKYTPHLLDAGVRPDGGRFYALEYLPYLPLNELFVHGRNSSDFWTRKFVLLKKFFADTRKAYEAAPSELEGVRRDAVALYEGKTASRLQCYVQGTGFSTNAVLTQRQGQPLTAAEIAHDCVQRALSMPVVPAVLHGDLCFSNILFDSRSECLKVIDPRGLNFEGVFSIYGDQKYDLAKLAHSVIGLYDFIIAGRFAIESDAYGYDCIRFEIDQRLASVQATFMDVSFIDGISIQKVMPLVVLLFLSMLPLHDDRPDRQKAMLLNAVRLYTDFVMPWG